MAARLIFLPPRLVIATVLLKAKSLLALFRKFPIFPRWPDRGSQDSLDRHLYRPRHVFPLPLPLQPLELGEGTLQPAVVQGLVLRVQLRAAASGWRSSHCPRLGRLRRYPVLLRAGSSHLL